MIHYALMGSPTGAVINFVGMFRSWSFMYKGKNKFTSGIYLPAIFLTIYIINGIVTWEGIITLVPTIASVIFCLVIWQHNTKNIRRFGLVVQTLWFFYALYLGSYVVMITEFILLISTTLAIIRLDIIKPTKTKDYKIKVNVFPKALEKIYDSNSEFLFDKSAIRNPNYIKFVCTLKNKPVGYIALYPHADFLLKKGFPPYEVGPFSVFVWHLVVDPNFARSGVATILLDEVKRIYEGYEIYSIVNSNNRPATLLYSTLGFSKKMEFERVINDKLEKFDLMQIVPKIETTQTEVLKLEYQEN